MPGGLRRRARRRRRRRRKGKKKSAPIVVLGPEGTTCSATRPTMTASIFTDYHAGTTILGPLYLHYHTRQLILGPPYLYHHTQTTLLVLIPIILNRTCTLSHSQCTGLNVHLSHLCLLQTRLSQTGLRPSSLWEADNLLSLDEVQLAAGVV